MHVVRPLSGSAPLKIPPLFSPRAILVTLTELTRLIFWQANVRPASALNVDGFASSIRQLKELKLIANVLLAESWAIS